MPKHEYESLSGDAVAMRAAILGGKLRRFERMADLQPGRWISFPIPGAERAEGRVRSRQSDVSLRGVQ